MANIHRKQLELIFNTSSGKQITFAILDPKDELTSAGANEAAQTILTKNIFTYSGGELATFEKAQIRVLDVMSL